MDISDLYRKNIDFRPHSCEEEWGRIYYKDEERSIFLRLSDKKAAMINLEGYTFVTKIPDSLFDHIKELTLSKEIHSAINCVFNIIKDQITIELFQSLLITHSDLSFDLGYQKAKTEVRDFLLGEPL